jgi:hypothetical protein
LVFQLPIKGDIDRTLSNLMHDARDRLRMETSRLMAEAAQAITFAEFADQIHDAAMKQATRILLDFIERMQLPPAEITAWARPQLENLGNTLLGQIPPINLPADHQRIVAQYRAVFQQRLDGTLRDVEIGFEKGAAVARTETPVAPATSGKGGRPKADWWEDLWIEICRQLYGGELIPKTQADIERAIHQWISDHGHTAGDTTVRDRASKLWRAIKVEN